MLYLGGKSRIASKLARVIDAERKPHQWVWDAFCGGLSMAAALSVNGPVLATDIHPALIALYQAIQNGWEPPNEVTREEYERAKTLPDSDPLKAFAGFACSFAGKWFKGYVDPFPKWGDGARRTRHRAAKRALSWKVAAVSRLECLDFLECQAKPTAALIYLDAPYAGTTGFAGVPLLDLPRYFEQIENWSRHTTVFVSEYSLPLGECVLEIPVRRTCRGDKITGAVLATERLYRVETRRARRSVSRDRLATDGSHPKARSGPRSPAPAAEPLQHPPGRAL